MYFGTAAFKSFVLVIRCIDGVIYIGTEKYRNGTLYFLYRTELVIISVETDGAVFLYIIKNLCLCLQDTISRSEIFQMALSDIRDQAHIRSCNLA